MARAGADKPDAFVSNSVPRMHWGRRDDVCLFTNMAVMIEGIVRKAGSPP